MSASQPGASQALKGSAQHCPAPSPRLQGQRQMGIASTVSGGNEAVGAAGSGLGLCGEGQAGWALSEVGFQLSVFWGGPLKTTRLL